MRRLIALVIVIAALFGGWYGYQRVFAAAPPARYTTAPVRRGSIVQTVSATGTVEPLVMVLVGSQVSGTIVRWYADFNQPVHEGFVLAELDQDRFRAQLEQRTAAVAVASARVEEAEARLALARLDRERIEQAYERSAASEYELRAARAEEAAALAALHAAQAQLQAAQADQRMAAIELEKTIIRSPIDGVVISRDVDAGQTVAASLAAPTLFTIANDLRRMRVNAAVSETDIGLVREGMPAEFRVDAYPGRRFQGVVSQVRYAQTVVDNVVTYTTLIEVDNSDLLLRPGMTATILFEVARAENALLVPNAALRFDPHPPAATGGWTRPGRGRPATPRVFRLEANQLVEVAIEPGLTDGSFTEVRGGALREGDLVVIDMQPTGATRAALPRMPRL
jgi:HlyD family secretion protein